MKKIQDNYKLQAKYFKVFIHPTRLAILDLLRNGEECVCHMVALLGLPQAHISQHLMILREAGLVSDRRDGWNIFYRVMKPEIYQVIDAMNDIAGKSVSGLAGDKYRIKLRDCPCPKCNSAEFNSAEQDQGMMKVKLAE